MRELTGLDSLRAIDPAKLTVLLEEIGWHLIGGRRGAYNRLAPPSDPNGRLWSLVVPLDRTAPEFGEMMELAFKKIAARDDREDWQSRLLPRLVVERTDEYRFRRETSLPPGLIRWKDGEGLIFAARATLIAGAKATMAKLRHFGNKHGQFANRYLDTVLMGQTAPGSYIVTAYAPSEGEVPIRHSPETPIGIPGIDYVQGKEIAKAITNALGAATEALEHFRETASLSGFDAGVESGVSYELANALVQLTEASDEADIVVEWHPSADEESSVSESFSFTGRDTEVLQRAASRLVTIEPEPRTQVVGRVHLLTKKEAGLPGVVGIEAIGVSKPKKVRAHLAESSDYHLAVRAHEEDLMIRVVGDLQREGNLNWLYGASVEEILGPVPESIPLEPGFDDGTIPIPFVEVIRRELPPAED